MEVVMIAPASIPSAAAVLVLVSDASNASTFHHHYSQQLHDAS
jgi:hypothetical protein